MLALTSQHPSAPTLLVAANSAAAGSVLDQKQLKQLRVRIYSRADDASETVAKAADPEAAFFVQLSALKNTAYVEPTWERIRRDHGEILEGLERTIQRTGTGRGLFHRILVGPFGSRDAAAGTCRALQARKQDCFVVPRKAYREGRLTDAAPVGFAPAVMVDEGPPDASPPIAGSRIEIVTRNGHRVIVEDAVDTSALARVLDVLERR